MKKMNFSMAIIIFTLIAVNFAFAFEGTYYHKGQSNIKMKITRISENNYSITDSSGWDGFGYLDKNNVLRTMYTKVFSNTDQTIMLQVIIRWKILVTTW